MLRGGRASALALATLAASVAACSAVPADATGGTGRGRAWRHEAVPASSPAEPARAWAPSMDAILFADFPAGGEEKEIFVVEPDGRGRTQLTRSEGKPESQPSWAPSRREVAYTTRLRDDPVLGEAWGLEALDLADGTTRTLTIGPFDVAPDWSPDGARVAYVSIFGYGTPSQGSSISLVDADGRNPRPLIELQGASLLQSPAWSPDGRRIAFSVGYATGGELYAMGADGHGAGRLFAHPGMDDIDPAWSPDGRYVVFASGPYRPGDRRARHDIWVLDTQTGQAGAVAADTALDLRDPAWSPDGDEIAYYAEVSAPPHGRWELYTVSWSGGAVRLLSTGVEPDWDSGIAPAPSATGSPGDPPTGTATAGPGPTGPATSTPPVPPTLPALPTLPSLPTLPPDGPTATAGPPPTFPAPTATASVRPSPSATVVAGPSGAHLPFAAKLHPLPDASATPHGTATAAPTSRCLHREIEPNDTTAEADARTGMCDDVLVRASLPAGDPGDMFRLDIDRPGAVEGHLSLERLPSGADFDLALYRAGRSDPVARGATWLEGRKDERLGATVQPGRYYLHVVVAPGSAHSESECVLSWFWTSGG